jgi:hypothetical protein
MKELKLEALAHRRDSCTEWERREIDGLEDGRMVELRQRAQG